MLEENRDRLVAHDPDAVASAVRMAVSLKARIVAADERETGPRRLLNLGHTVGHAIEAARGGAIRHGEAVALGIIAAFRIGRALGCSNERSEHRATELLRGLGLPVDLSAHLGPSVFRWLGVDKKREGDQVRFVVPRAPGATEVVSVSLDELKGFLASA